MGFRVRSSFFRRESRSFLGMTLTLSAIVGCQSLAREPVNSAFDVGNCIILHKHYCIAIAF